MRTARRAPFRAVVACDGLRAARIVASAPARCAQRGQLAGRGRHGVDSTERPSAGTCARALELRRGAPGGRPTARARERTRSRRVAAKGVRVIAKGCKLDGAKLKTANRKVEAFQLSAFPISVFSFGTIC